ncbi:succinate dehydrogenase hydrophobic membrane anchor subunit [Rathayibacter sp. VKM Ac-2856]|uniref:succinate dehydrogenase hydrophobic membrane anchor subunit n=1 Tax=unclassified Rathayibacter TaxID=2609250 RepID=UPI00156483A1|nr:MULTISPECIES: succinate dehydrogenase hydrophobic membrane anchor subunit [unclassified Rathayibacter]NQX04184.1 succinate dehydrogenase hydrophobic membrane anchor subunit [Rathayibacter sp. VKM Ac-2858]NQX19353.1 succinate dehydrogenase hydrophobic membrane anchor subunit [Rathayibacter sp. VKM Ac-2856]
MSTVAAPRTPIVPTRSSGTNWEKWGWIYMRASGVVLIVLIFGHLIFNLLLGEGIKAIDFGFVGGKLANPFWQWWDVAMLWLALIHGGNGMRTLVNDYATSPLLARVFKGGILVSVVVLIALGTYVVFGFNPCPTGGDPSLLPSFCAA